MSAATATVEPGIRSLTDAEVADYQRNGWVKVEQLVAPELVAAVLARLKARMGEEADQPVTSGYDVKTPRPAAARLLFTTYEAPSRDDPLLHAFAYSQGLGSAFSRCAGGPVRYWGDRCYVKMPVTREGGKTPWHQDWPYYPFDRAGSLTIWIALVDIPPERGTMRFVAGSHLWGPQGRVIGRSDGLDTLDILPGYLRDKVEISPPLHLRPGDATIHNDMTIHSAPPNTTDALRWVFAMSAFPSDALFTGCPQRRTDELGLTLNQPLDHPAFPLLAQRY